MDHASKNDIPLISVIVPVFNTAAYLNLCLDSILNQTYDNLEILLIDDGSTDGSSDLCDEYALHDPRVTVLHLANAGVSAARNTGIEMASGKYLSFIDSDDIIHPRFFELMTALIADRDIAECGFVKFSDESPEFTCKDSAEIIKAATVVSSRERRRVVLQKGCSVWRFLFKKEKIKDLRFNTELKQAEDTLFAYESLLRCGPVVKIDEPLYGYRQRDGSAVSTIDSSGYLDRARAERYMVDQESILSESSKRDALLVLMSIRLMNRYRSPETRDLFLKYRKDNRRNIMFILFGRFQYFNPKEKIYLVYDLFIKRPPVDMNEKQ